MTSTIVNDTKSDTIDTPSRNSRARAWCFTLNNYTVDSIENLKALGSDTDAQYIFGEEVGEKGTPHLQGAIRWKNARSFNSVRTLIEGAHIERCKNWHASIKYCSKDGKTYDNLPKKKPIKIIEKLFPWQQKIVDEIATEPDDRTINWIYDTKGCIGKTALTKYLCVKNPDKILVVSGKAADAKYAIAELVAKDKEPEAVLFHFTRTNEQYVSYEAIEAIKDGLFFNTKYESRQVVMNCPHVFIFANFPPIVEKLSADRWNIVNLTKSDEPPPESPDESTHSAASGLPAEDAATVALPPALSPCIEIVNFSPKKILERPN